MPKYILFLHLQNVGSSKKYNNSLSNTPASLRKQRIPLNDIGNQSPLAYNIQSPLSRGVKNISLRERVMSQSTVARLTPPVKSLTSTLQDSLNWGTSTASEGSSFQKESTRLSSILCEDKSSHILKLSSLAIPHHLDVLESTGHSSFNMSDSVFESSISINVSSDSLDGQINDHSQCAENGRNCDDVNCNSHLKAPSRQESIMDDTPQMHRSDESVWNSYAARNLRSMRHGSYSEDSDDNDERQSEHSKENSDQNFDRKSSTGSCMKSSISTEVTDSSRPRNGSDSCDFSYHSDHSDDESVSKNDLKSDRLIHVPRWKGRKRGFDLVEKSPVQKRIFPGHTGLTQEINLLQMYGDEHRLKRSNSEGTDIRSLAVGGEHLKRCSSENMGNNSKFSHVCHKQFGTDVDHFNDFVSLQSDSVAADACGSLCKDTSFKKPLFLKSDSNRQRNISGPLDGIAHLDQSDDSPLSSPELKRCDNEKEETVEMFTSPLMLGKIEGEENDSEHYVKVSEIYTMSGNYSLPAF